MEFMNMPSLLRILPMLRNKLNLKLGLGMTTSKSEVVHCKEHLNGIMSYNLLLTVMETTMCSHN